jgi:hypothetical protein
MRRLSILVFLFAPLVADARPTPLSAAQTRGELAINVKGETRGNYYAYPRNDGKLTKTRILGNGVKTTDVIQGALNDCDVVGTMAAIAHSRPQAIAKAFVTKGNGHLDIDADGRVAMRLGYGKSGNMKKDVLRVSAALVHGPSGKPVFTQAPHDRLWAPLIEKGYATLLSKHGRLKGMTAADQGGLPKDVIESITGERAVSRTIDPTPRGAEIAWQTLKTADERNEIIVAGSLAEGEFRHRRSVAVKSGLVDREAKRWTQKGQRMVADHDEAILGVSEHDGQRFVKIRNEWNSYVPRGSGRNHGEYELPIEKFALFFSDITHTGKRISVAAK